MNRPHSFFKTKPQVRPVDPRFSSGPCRKHPGWKVTPEMLRHLGRSHRSKDGANRLGAVVSRMAKLLELPQEWVCGIVPGSGTGACSMALQNLLGPRPVETFLSDGFSQHWAREIDTLNLAPQHLHRASFGSFPDTSGVDPAHDIVMVLNGTNSGVVPPGFDWLPVEREGLVICDAVSAAFTMRIDYSKVDVICWSWQKALGGEGGHGMIALSPRAQRRLQGRASPQVSKLMRLHKPDGSLNGQFFLGHTISTPSMFAVEDVHSALDWADAQGGLDGLLKRVGQNHAIMSDWVACTDWIDWVCTDPLHRSAPSVCLRLATGHGAAADSAVLKKMAAQMARLLEREQAGFDIWSYGDAPPGFRIWAGPTVDASDLMLLCDWLDWAYRRVSSHLAPQTTIDAAFLPFSIYG